MTRVKLPIILTTANRPYTQAYISVVHKDEPGLHGEFFGDISAGIRQHMKASYFQPYVYERGYVFPEGKYTGILEAKKALKHIRRYHGMLNPGEIKLDFNKGEILTRKRLMRKLKYFASSGEFRRLTDFKDMHVGSTAGYVAPGDSHVSVQVFGQIYPMQRLAWLYDRGEWPCFLIRHVNGDKLNNSMKNLEPMVSEY